MMLCRDPEGGYARWICPGCQYVHRVPFSCKTRFCPSCGKVHVDNWVNDFAKDMLDVPHIPPKGLQMVRYAGLYASCVERRCLEIANAALEAIRTQFPLFALDPLLKSVAPLKWRERIKASFGFDPVACPRCGRTMELAEIWEPKRGFVWMKRWLETHRMRKAARDAMKEAAQVKQPRRPKSLPKYQQLPLVCNTS